MKFDLFILHKRGWCCLILSYLAKSLSLCMPSIHHPLPYHLWAIGHSPHPGTTLVRNSHFVLNSVFVVIMVSKLQQNSTGQNQTPPSIDKPSGFLVLFLLDSYLFHSALSFLKCFPSLASEVQSVLFSSYLEKKYQMCHDEKKF